MKRSFIFLYILHILNDGYFASLILLLPFITTALHFNLFQAGILGSLTGFMGIALAIPAGHASIKWGGTRVLLCALAFYTLAYLLLSGVSSFIFAFIVFAVASIGLGVFHPVGFGLVAKFSDKKTRGRDAGTFTSIGDIGKTGITAVFTFIIAAIGWRQTTLLYGGIAGIILLIFIIIHKKNPHINIGEKTRHLKIKTLFQNKRFLLSVTAGTLDVFSSFPIFIFLPFLLLQKGFSTSILGALVGAYLVGNILGKTIMGRGSDKYGHIKIFVVAELLMAVFIVLLALSNNLISIIVFSIILGILTKGTVPVTQVMVTDAVEHHGNFEKSISVFSTVANVAVAGSPILMGAISNFYGVTYAFYAAAGFALVAIVPAILIPLTKRHE